MLVNDLRNRHVNRLGFPTNPNGALYYVTDEEGLCQMAVDIANFQYLASGMIMSPLERSQIENDVRFMRNIYNSKLASLGIPENLRILVNISKKGELEKYCNKLAITETDLFLLIKNCHLIGYLHESKFPAYIPEHLAITEADSRKLREGNPKPITKKLIPTIQERRQIHAHFFYRDDEWHCFYFSYEDIEASENNHWRFGSHIHFINYLWPQYTRGLVVSSFDTRRTKLYGNVHIKFTPFDYPDTESYSDSLMPKFGQEPGAFAFDPSLASNNSLFPTPCACVAARGAWIAKIYLGEPAST